jgi:NAD(P)H-quinone oxidoreductase subunit 5
MEPEGMLSVSQDLLRFPLVLAALIPMALIFAALFVTRSSPFKAASIVTVMAVELSAIAVVLHAIFSFSYTTIEGKSQLDAIRGLVQLDLVSCAMLLLVCTLSVVVVRYSERYLSGEGGLPRYVRSLLLTLAAVTILVISNHLGLTIVCWGVTQLTLHQLLTFYQKRRQAVIVAHKKFLIGMIANILFFAALWVIQGEIGSLHIDIINAYALAHPGLTPSLHLAMMLFAVGVLLKTAQLPFHGWILQVMEAPTPVSSLLHAGVVNIGGFVCIRLAPLWAGATLAQWILLGVGLFTSILGSLVMATRPTIKVLLAWSTIAQMGFMLVQCGLGVWHLALMHLLAHSFYKAHAFLSSGTVVETWRGSSLVHPKPPSLTSVAIAAAIAGLAGIPLWAFLGFGPLHAPTSFVTFTVALGLSFVPMLAKAITKGGRTIMIVAVYTAGASASYFLLHAGFEAVAPSLNIAEGETSLKWAIVIAGLMVLFVAQTFLQTSPNGRLGSLLQPHIRSGLYFDDWFTRLTFKLWPPKLERPAGPARRSSITLEAR